MTAKVYRLLKLSDSEDNGFPDQSAMGNPSDFHRLPLDRVVLGVEFKNQNYEGDECY